jgi:hypothetical protein
VHPVLAGNGARLFAGQGRQVPLTLVETRAHGNGIVALRYALAG